MAKVTGIKSSFNGGELSPLLDGRVDIAKYSTGCSEMTNFMATVQGPAMRRPGTKFVTEVKNSAQRTWLAKFEFNYRQSFILEFGDRYIRFFINHAPLLSGTPAAWSNVTDYFVGDLVSSGGINYYCRIDNTNVPPAANPNTWYALSGTIYEIPTPYALADLTTSDGSFALSMVQSGDVIYIANRNYPPQKLSRFSNTDWTIAPINITTGPFLNNNTEQSITVEASSLITYIGTNFAEYTVNLTASDASVFSGLDTNATAYPSLFQMEVASDELNKPWIGNGHVTAVDDICRNELKYYGCDKATTPFETGSVSPAHTYGARYDGDDVSWWYLADQIGVMRIETIPTTLTATATVIKQIMPVTTDTTSNTWAWSKPAWSSALGWPAEVSFFRERLVFARDTKVWFSVAGDYENFSAKEFGEVTPDSAISADVPFETSTQITYLVSTKSGLIVGSTDGEALISESSTAEPFGPTNFKATNTTAYGSRDVNPVGVDNVVLFLQQSGRKLRESYYDFNTDNVIANDVTILAEHITAPTVIDMAYHRDPYTTLWCARSDGALLGFTYNKAQDVTGWHKHFLGGDGIVEAVQVIPRFDGTQDDLWMIVRRTIDGQSVRYIEYMEKDYATGDDQADAYYVDCGITYSGAAVTTISGLDWLEGETVQVLTQGGTTPDVVVTGGAITLPRATTKAQIGLQNIPVITTMRFEGGSQNGSSQGKTKLTSKINLRLLNSLGVKAGTGEGNYPYQLIDLRQTSTPMGTPPPLKTGDYLFSPEGGYNTDAKISVTTDQPFPITLIAIVPDINTHDR